ncbi:hypothetical protein Emag_002987 [Eimeria magna]
MKFFQFLIEWMRLGGFLLELAGVFEAVLLGGPLRHLYKELLLLDKAHLNPLQLSPASSSSGSSSSRSSARPPVRRRRLGPRHQEQDTSVHATAAAAAATTAVAAAATAAAATVLFP